MTLNIHTWMDSFGGFTLGTFTPPPSHPLYELRGPAEALNLWCAQNGVTDVVATHRGRAIDGNTSPASEEQVIIQAVIDSGVILPGDVIVIEDAGPHGSDPPGYQATLTAVINRFTSQIANLTVLVLTTADYPPAAATDQYDRPINGLTTNDARRRAVAAYGSERIKLLDLNARQDEIRAEMLQEGVQQYVDGVHQEVWGQFVMLRLIAEGAGILDRLPHWGAMADLIATNVSYVQYGSSLAAARARQWVARLLGVPVVSYLHLPGTLEAAPGTIEDAPGVLTNALETVKPEHTFVLGTLGLMQAKNGYSRSAARQVAPKLATSGLSNANLLNDEVVPVDSWYGGEGFLIHEPETPDRYRLGSGIDPQAEEGAVGLGHFLTTVNVGAVAINAFTCAKAYAGKLYIGGSDGKIYTWDGSSFALFQNWGKSTGGVTCMEVFADSIWFGNGQDGVIARYDGTTWTATHGTVSGIAGGSGTLQGIRALAVHYGDGIPRLYYAATTTLYGQIGQGSATGTIDGGDDFAILGGRIDVLIPYKKRLVAIGGSKTAKTNYWSLHEGDNSNTIGWEFKYGPVENSFILCAAVLDDVLYLGDAIDGRIWRWDGSDLSIVRQLGSDLDPYTKSGSKVEIRGMLAYRGKLYVSIVDADDSLALLVYDGNKTWYRPATGLTGTLPNALAQFDGRLFLLTEESGAAKIYRTDGTFCASGYVQSGLMDGGFGASPKLWTGVKVTHSELVSGQSVQVEFDLDNQGSWTSLGTSATVGETAKEFALPNGTKGRQIATRTTLTGPAGGSTPLKVFDVVAFYKPAPGIKRTWELTVPLQGQDLPSGHHRMTLHGGTTETLIGEEISARIWEMVDADEPVCFLDKDRQRQVPVYILDYKEADQSGMPQVAPAAGQSPMDVGWDMQATLRLQEA